MSTAFLSHVLGLYSPAVFPCLHSQLATFEAERFLTDVRIMHASPVFENTLLKFLPLIAAGADIRFSVTRSRLHDPAVGRLLREHGFEFYDTIQPANVVGEIDITLDCTGSYSHVTPLVGAVELTRSGEAYYQDKPYPVISVDRSPLKALEDSHGTADAFIRAMNQLGHTIDSSATVIVFGYGKVGKGIVRLLLEKGANVFVVDKEGVIENIRGVEAINYKDSEQVYRALREAGFVVTCTGVKGAVGDNFDMSKFIQSRAILVNMGAEDEYGKKMPAERVLNGKKPVNFILEDPTQTIYIDPIFALHNQMAVYLLSERGRLPSGIFAPPQNVEQAIIAQSPLRTLLPR
jgi:adenosylhomocysteinase